MLSYIGRYKVIKFIGEGGAGQVYHALDESVERDVAIKLLTTDAHDQRFRFKREAKLLAKLDHPNIVPIYDFGEQDGWPFIVMRFIPGGTLHDLLKSKRLSYAEIVEIIDQISEAIDFAHGKEIVHRDIKPANILFDDLGRPLIADFGLSKIFTSDTGPNPTQNKIVGTPNYMSPEQGRGQKLDKLTDIYSLGIILFEMCNGDVPFKGEDPFSIIYKHIHEAVPDMDHLPRQIANVIEQGMSQTPENRYQSAGEMAKAFSKAVNGLTKESQTPPKEPEKSPFWATFGTRIAWVGAAVVAIAAIGYFSMNSILPDLNIFGVSLTTAEESLDTSEESVFDLVTDTSEGAVSSDDDDFVTATIIPTGIFSAAQDESSVGEETATETPEPTQGAARFVITREEVEVFAGPSETDYEKLDFTVEAGDELELIAKDRENGAWVNIELSLGTRGWIKANSGVLDGIDKDNVEVAATLPPTLTPPPMETATAEPTATPTETATPTAAATNTPTATPTSPATATPIPVVVPTNTPVPLNPLDLDGDGVIHNPEAGQFDLCEDRPGFTHTCGCPEGEVPASCGGSDGDRDQIP
ncbi:MAG: protein kinase [Chloroflexota bacterium]